VQAEAREGELRHGGLADDHRPGAAQAPHHDGVVRRGRVAPRHLGPRERRLAADVEEVLDRHHRPVERPERQPDAGARIRRLRLHAGLLGIRLGEHERLLADAGKAGFETGDGGEHGVRTVGQTSLAGKRAAGAKSPSPA